MSILTIIGAKYLYLISLALLVIFSLYSKEINKKRFVIIALFSFILAYALAKVAGFIYYDPRPFVLGGFAPLIPHAADNGFPSDHALLTGAVASLVYAYNRKWGLWLWALAALVGVSRVLAGIHHPVDIIASFAFGIISVYAVTRFISAKV